MMGSMLGQNRVIAKDVKGCTYCYYVRCTTLIVWLEGKPWPKTGTAKYHAQLGFPDNGRTIKVLVVCNDWDLLPLYLLNGLALGCYQPSPEVLIVLYLSYVIRISICQYYVSDEWWLMCLWKIYWRHKQLKLQNI